MVPAEELDELNQPMTVVEEEDAEGLELAGSAIQPQEITHRRDDVREAPRRNRSAICARAAAITSSALAGIGLPATEGPWLRIDRRRLLSWS
jgi:hypothetical protein